MLGKLWGIAGQVGWNSYARDSPLALRLARSERRAGFLGLAGNQFFLG
jgi:hypothetical protein